MGVGFPLDVVVSVALGCDMFDCVFPCRTARFGTALTHAGSIRIRQSKYSRDLRPLDEECNCYTCCSYSRAFLHATFSKGPAVGRLLTLHNLHYMHQLCSSMRASILENRFSDFVFAFLERLYPRQTASACKRGRGEEEQENAVVHAKRRKLENGKAAGGGGEGMQAAAAAEENTKDERACVNRKEEREEKQPKSSPPLWVRDALSAAGIDISHLYSSFDSNEGLP
ncbi:hypothetical protein Efla_004685 [Eimeria flavescens]